MKRRGRERLRFNKRRVRKRLEAKGPIFVSRYNLLELKDKIVEIKCGDEIYTGKFMGYTLDRWPPNYKYALFRIKTPDGSKSFYYCFDKSFIHYDAIKGREWKRDWTSGDGKKCKINRILTKVESLLFKIEHTL